MSKPKPNIVEKFEEYYVNFTENSIAEHGDISTRSAFFNGALAMMTVINDLVSDFDMSEEEAINKIDDKMEHFATEYELDLALYLDASERDDEDSDSEDEDEEDNGPDEDEEEFEDIDPDEDEEEDEDED